MARLTACFSTLLVLLVVLVALGESSPRRSCCTEYTAKPIRERMLISYRIQEVTDICHIRAIRFRTVNKKTVCANPDDKWVQEAMEYIDTKQKL